MEMSFYFSATYMDFLFSGVDITTPWGMVSLCLGLLTLSVLVEGLKVARSLLLKVAQGAPVSGFSSSSSSHTSERVKLHLLQTLLHVLHLTLGYGLMLVVMTYDAYFFIAVVVGAGLGYYCFSLFDLPGKVLGAEGAAHGGWQSPCPPPPVEAVPLYTTSSKQCASKMPIETMISNADEVEKNEMPQEKCGKGGSKSTWDTSS